MSNLLKIQRALDLNQEWVSVISTACELVGLEYTREIGVKVSYNLRENITLENDGSVIFSDLDDTDVLEEVEKFFPEYPPSLVAALLVTKDLDFKERVKSFCVSEDYIYSEKFETIIAEILARDKNTKVKVTGIREVNSLDVDDNKLKSTMKTAWGNVNPSIEEEEEEDE